MDDEIKGEGNSLNYTFRMHDPRVGRFFTVDPLQSDFPWNSSYAFSENKVIHAIELEGLEAYVLNSESEEYTYNQTATENNVPKGYEYVGPSILDVTADYAARNPLLSFFGYDPPFEGGRVNGPDEVYATPDKEWKIGNFTIANWSYLERGKGGEQAVYEAVNGFNIVASYLAGNSVGDSSMRNLDGTSTTTQQGVLGFTSTASFALTGPMASSMRTEKFYRAMSFSEYDALIANRGLSFKPGTELFVSTRESYTRAFLQKSEYDVLVQFNLRSGALNNMASNVVRNGASSVINQGFGNLPKVYSGWADDGLLLFKGERGSLNIGLQQNTGSFNNLIKNIKWID